MGIKRVATAEARGSFKDVVEAVRENGQRVKITRYGKTLAFIVPAAEGNMLEECQEELKDCADKRAAAASAPTQGRMPTLAAKGAQQGRRRR